MLRTRTAILLLLAFAALALTLTWQSLWLDEVFSIYYVERPFDDAWRSSIFPEQNPHATLYYLSMWVWIRAAGTSDFAVRYFSLLTGTAAIALIGVLARAWLGARATPVAMLLLTVSPFAFWHMQEARQYALYLCLALLSTYCLWRLINSKPGIGLIVAYALSATAMAYAHFFSVFAVAAQCIVGAVLCLRRPPALARLICAAVITAIACAPIPLRLIGSGRTFDQADITRVALPLDGMLREMLAEYSTRLPAAQGASWLLIAFGLTFIAGGIMLWRRNRRAAFMVTGLALLPALLFLPIAARVSVFSPKYALAAMPMFVLALSALVTAALARRRAAGLAVLALLTGASAWGIYRDFTNPDVQRENWRFAARFLARETAAGETILVFADYSAPVLQHYFKGPANVVKITDPWNASGAFDQAQQGDGRRLWVLLSHDQNAAPNHKILDVAYARYPWAYAQYPSLGAIKVLGFSMRWRTPALPPDAQPVANARFANGLQLLGFKVDQTRLPPYDRISHPPSNWIHVTTYWSRWKPVEPGDAQPALRLIGADGGEWGGDLSRRPNVFDFDPPAKWADGDIIESHADVNLNPLTPPGAYTLEARVLVGETRLSLDGAQANGVALTGIEITR